MRVLEMASGLVDRARVCKPCDADWDAMVGDDRVRFCTSCRKNVHDLSAITAAEGERLLQGGSGRVCIIVERDSAGRTITADRLPPGMTPARRLATLAAAATVAMAAAACTKSDAPASPSGSASAREQAPDGGAAATTSASSGPRRLGCYCRPGEPLCSCL